MDLYPEDVLTIIMLGVIIALVIVAVILLVFLVRKTIQGSAPSFNRNDKLLKNNAVTYSYCKRCGAKYDSKLKKCPECGLPR